MYENQIDALVEEAVALAACAFENPTDGHIDCIFERLAINFVWGLGPDGAVTIH